MTTILISEDTIGGKGIDFQINYSFDNQMGSAQIYYQNNSLRIAAKRMGYDSIGEVDDQDDLNWILTQGAKNKHPEIVLVHWKAANERSGFAYYCMGLIFDIAEKHDCYYLRIFNPNANTRAIMERFTELGYVRPDTQYKQGISVAEHHYRYFLLKRPPTKTQ